MSGTVFGVPQAPITGVEHVVTNDPPRRTTTGAIAALALSGGSGVPLGGTINVTPATAPLVITGNSAVPDSFPQATLLELVSANGQNARISLDAFGGGAGTGGSALFAGRVAQGTPAAPTAVLADQQIILITALGYGATGYTSAGKATFALKAAEQWTDSAQGTYQTWSVTATGSTTLAEAMRLQNSGILSIGATAASGTSKLQVTGGISSDNIATSGYVSESTGNALTAAGSSRTDALALTNQINNITTAAASTGVILPSSVAIGTIVTIFNAGANAIKVYGAGSDTIDGVAGATGVPLTNAKRCIYIAVATATWISAQLGVVSA